MGWFSGDSDEVGTETHEDATANDSQSTRVSWPVDRDGESYDPKADRFGWL